MSALPEVVGQAWEKRQGPIVLTTVDAEGTPNAIYASCVQRYGEDAFIVADNYMHKTRANVLGGSRASLLFITEERSAYQCKGWLQYVTSGPAYEAMKSALRSGLPGHAAVVLHVDRVYKGAEELL